MRLRAQLAPVTREVIGVSDLKPRRRGAAARARLGSDVRTETDYRERGPRIGEIFPNVNLLDQRGELVDLQQRRGRGHAVVVFNRSAVW